MVTLQGCRRVLESRAVWMSGKDLKSSWPKAERRRSLAAKLAFLADLRLHPCRIHRQHCPSPRSLFEFDKQPVVLVIELDFTPFRSESAFCLAHSTVEMGKLTSTIGIPIKLLNEAQVRDGSPLK